MNKTLNIGLFIFVCVMAWITVNSVIESKAIRAETAAIWEDMARTQAETKVIKADTETIPADVYALLNRRAKYMSIDDALDELRYVYGTPTPTPTPDIPFLHPLNIRDTEGN